MTGALGRRREANVKNPNILISGASIAGLTLAYWLHRHGFHPTVVERAPGVREGGYKIDLRGAALEVADRMGVLEQIRQVPTDVRTGSIVDATGRRLASMSGDTFGGRVSRDAEVMRGDLTRILFDRAATGVEYLFGTSLTSLTEDAEGVSATLSNGQTRRFHLVIGCDGLHSHTRSLVFGPEARFLRELGHYVCIYSVPNHLGLDREELTYVGAGRTALVYSTARDVGARAMFLFASEPLKWDRHDRAAQQRILQEAFSGEGWEVPRLLERVGDAPDFYFDSISQIQMDAWSSGRVVLVGDAAYCASPASGQGSSLALVGAYVLAGELAAAKGDHLLGFSAYEKRLRPFVKRNQELGPSNIKRMVMRTRGQVRFSLAMLALLNRLPGKDRLMAKVTEPIHRAANAIDLASY